jgi:hypothetical protein
MVFDSGGGGGGSSQPQTVTQTSTQQPPAYLQPFLTDIAKEAQSQYQSGSPSYFPENTFVPQSPETQQALSALTNRATTGSPLQAAGNQQQLGTVQGDYLNSNPGLVGAIDAAVRPVTQNFQNAVLPGIASQFSAAGRYGSGAQADALGNASDAYMRNVGDIGSNLSFGNYNMERGIQNQAAQNAPSMAAADYTDPSRLAAVGQQQETYSAAELQDAINRFNFGQNLPNQKLGQYSSAIYGQNQGGTTSATQTSPYYSGNTALAGLGAGLSTVGTAGNLFGKGGSNILNK